MELVVITPFDSYKRGDTITNPTTMAAVLGSDRARFVVKVQGSGTGTIDPANQPTLLELLSALLSTNNNLPEALTSYDAAKASDLTAAKNDVLTALAAIPTTNLATVLNSYGAAHTTDVDAARTAILAAVAAIPSTDVAAALATYGAAKPTDVTTAVNTAITAVNTAKTQLATAIAEIPTTDVAATVLAYGTAKTTDVNAARNLVLAAVEQLGEQTLRTGEVAAFRPDSEGNPPSGWAWLGAASYEDGRHYSVTDKVSSQSTGPVQWVQSNSHFFADFDTGYLISAVPTIAPWAMTWPADFVATRIGAARYIAAEGEDAARLVCVAKGTVMDEPTVVATVLQFNGGTFSWDIASQTSASTLTLGVTVPDFAQSFAWLGDINFIRGSHPSFSSPGNCLGINIQTGELMSMAFPWSPFDYAPRFIAANGLLVAVTSNGLDRFVRARLLAVDLATHAVSVEASSFIALSFDPGDIAAYDHAAPEPALGFAVNDGLVVSTAGGLFQLTATESGLKTYQVAGPHPLVTAQVGGHFPQRFGSFAGLALDGEVLRFFGADGAATSNNSLAVNLPEYLASFTRRAYRL